MHCLTVCAHTSHCLVRRTCWDSTKALQISWLCFSILVMSKSLDPRSAHHEELSRAPLSSPTSRDNWGKRVASQNRPCEARSNSLTRSLKGIREHLWLPNSTTLR